MKKEIQQKSLAQQLCEASIDRFVMFLMVKTIGDFEEMWNSKKFNDAIKEAKEDVYKD